MEKGPNTHQNSFKACFLIELSSWKGRLGFVVIGVIK
jgi:hypothetical protein